MRDDMNYYSPPSELVGSRNKILQKAYGLLGLSFIPCAMGAAIPFLTGFNLLYYGNVGLLVSLAAFYFLVFMIEKNRYSSTGVALLMIFTFVMGLEVGSYIQIIRAVAVNGSKIVSLAAMMTAGIFLVMSAIAPRLNVGQRPFSIFMLAGVIILMPTMLINIFFLKMPLVSFAVCCGFVLFSSAGIVYETKRALDWGETSHISIALGLFVHIYNLFVSLLSILNILSRD